MLEDREFPPIVKDIHGPSFEMAALEEAGHAAGPGDKRRRDPHLGNGPNLAFREDLGLVEVRRDEVGHSPEHGEIPGPGRFFKEEGARARQENRVDDPGDARVPGQDLGRGG